MRESYPLQWPQGWTRTKVRQSSRFKVTEAVAINEMLDEIRKFSRDANPTLTSNVMGLRNRPEDPGVSVFFKKAGRTLCVGCDTYDKVQDNIRGIGLTIKAMRDIERYACSAMLEQMYNAYAVPMLSGGTARETLGLPENATVDQAEQRYRALIKSAHPDAGGTESEAAKLNDAIKQIREGR